MKGIKFLYFLFKMEDLLNWPTAFAIVGIAMSAALAFRAMVTGK